VLVADRYPNFSTCGLPHFLSGEVPDRLSVEALNALDLSYTPPFGSPRAAVQAAAQDWAREAYFATGSRL